MSTQDDAKKFVNNLKDALKAKGFEIKLGQVYDAISEAQNHKNFRTMKEVNKEWHKEIIDITSTHGLNQESLRGIGKEGDRFFINFERMALIEMSLSVEAETPQEAIKLAQKYYDNNEQHCRDHDGYWEIKEVMDKGGISTITNFTLENILMDVDGGQGQLDTDDQVTVDAELAYVSCIDDGEYLYHEDPRLDDLDSKKTIVLRPDEIAELGEEKAYKALKEEVEKRIGDMDSVSTVIARPQRDGQVKLTIIPKRGSGMTLNDIWKKDMEIKRLEKQIIKQFQLMSLAELQTYVDEKGTDLTVMERQLANLVIKAANGNSEAISIIESRMSY